MRKYSIDFYLIKVVVATSFCMLLAASCLAQPQHQPSSSQNDSLRKFLQEYAGSHGSSADKTMFYFPAFVDLADDGTQEVVVYVTGNIWCGSGGCTVLVLAPKDSSYKVVTKITISRLPIRILTTKSNGWHDIAIRVHGGGIRRAYDSKLSFNGKTYPSNPSAPPARRLVKGEAGDVIVPLTAAGKPLY